MKSLKTMFKQDRVSKWTCTKYLWYGHFRDKNTILHLMYEIKYGRIKNKNIIFFLQCFKKRIFAIFIQFAWRIHSAGDIYKN